MENETRHVFISHSGTDGTLANALCQFLEKQGLRCWIAPRDTPAGSEFPLNIMKGINASNAMIVLLSQAANRSDFVRAEIGIARKKDIAILPFRIERDLPVDPSLAFLLHSPQHLDASQGKMEDHFQTLYRHCAGL